LILRLNPLLDNRPNKDSTVTRYIALLRAVNVGGTGKLPMAVLRKMCSDAGSTRVETYIASGNVVFDSEAPASRVKAELEARLLAYSGKPVGVMVRTDEEMAAVLKANPFPDVEPKFTYAIFLDAPPPPDALKHAVGRGGEVMRLGEKEIFVHYGDGMGRSNLRIPAAKTGTARNMITVAKLVEMATAKEDAH
jgi:uncharacterized protein (DUF1697 family)